MPERPEDLHAAIVGRAQLGDREAMDAVLRALQAPLLRHVTFLLGDGDDGADVLQDVLWAVARSLQDLDDPRLVRAWAFRIATRRAVRFARGRGSKGRVVSLDDQPEPGVPVEDDTGLDPELLAAMPAAVAALPAGCGAAMRLHYLEELSLLEVAEALAIPVGTVKSRLAHGRLLLRRRFGAHRDSPGPSALS